MRRRRLLRGSHLPATPPAPPPNHSRVRSGEARRNPSRLGTGLALLVGLMGGCAETIPEGRLGVEAVRYSGMDAMDEDALQACLATRPRDRFSFEISANPSPTCNVPPFDAEGVRVRFWSWPWADWPLYDPAVFERDIDRIERWYEARGYYDARVLSSRIIEDEEESTVEVELAIREGAPVILTEIAFRGLEDLPEDARDSVREAVLLKEGERFDEALYEQSKESMGHALAEASFAQAEVHGHVLIHPAKHEAVVVLTALPGPPCEFGEVRVEGNEHLPKAPILGAAYLKRGQPYSESALREAQRAIYALGPFASVEVVPEVQPESDVVDVLIRVSPGRMFRYGVGVGIASGTVFPRDTTTNAAQWDVHLLGRIEHRNFLGGMRRLRIEERPRFIFNNSFPEIRDKEGNDPSLRDNLGNVLTVEFRQPAFLEPRTRLVAATRYDFGPDPYEFFRRHDLDTWIGPERSFFGGKLAVATTLHFNLQRPLADDRVPYLVTFLQYNVQVDLRNDTFNPRKGAYFAVGVQQAGYFLQPTDWDYVRLTPEVRGYLPLPARMVLAARFRLGMMFLEPTDPQVADDPDLGQVGPVAHRLRGGGQNSVRGFAPNTLGDALIRVAADGDRRFVSGGRRQWEASLELRVPITLDFSTALFFDMGDVTRQTHFRFDHPQASAGFGLRYKTIVGPIRLDVGFRLPGLQVFGEDTRPGESAGVLPPDRGEVLGIDGLDGALHLTIGESF